MATENPLPGAPEIFSRFLEFRLAHVHTTTPGRVVTFDAAKNQADVQPLLMRVYVDAEGNETLSPAPLLVGVPILFPRGGGFCITWDIVPGDIVMLMFCERSIDAWAVNGEMTDPKPRRKHDWSDAIAIPGVAPEVNAIAGVAPGQLRVGAEDGSVEMVLDRTSGNVAIKGLTVTIAEGSQPVGRVGDEITITDPGFIAWLAALTPLTVAPYVLPVKGTITTGSPKVTSG